MPLHDQTENATGPWSPLLSVPTDGDIITADAAAPTDSPVNVALQTLLNRGAMITQGTVSIKSISVDGTGEQAAAPGAGNIVASGNVAAGGNISTAGNVAAVGNISTGAGTIQTVSGNIETSTGNIATGSGDVIAGGYVQASDVDNEIAKLSGSGVAFTNVGTGSTDGNPGASVAITNRLLPANITKAMGRIKIQAGTIVPLSGLNVGSEASFQAATVEGTATHAIKVVMASAMQDASYEVQVTATKSRKHDGTSYSNLPIPAGSGTADGDPAIAPTATTFFITFGYDVSIDGGSVLIDPSVSTSWLDVCFTVFGRQTS